MADSAPLKDNVTERRDFALRTIVVFLAALALILGLLGRFVQLQVVKHAEFQTRAEDNRIHVRPVAPARGLIFDRSGVLLADNRPIATLAVTPEWIEDEAAFRAEIAELVELSDEQYKDFEKRVLHRRRPFEAVGLRFNLTEEEEAALAVNRHRWRGVEVVRDVVRYYPFGELLSHAVGSVRRVTEEDLGRLDPVSYSATRFIGKRGLERFYERSLHGQVGYEQVEADARGRILRTLTETPPVPGQNITLHLDSRLQIAAQGALGDRRGALVALDARTGGILALVSSPGYDPNSFVTGMTNEEYERLASALDTPLFNRAVNGQYAPGSTFKPVMGLAALRLGVTTWDETVVDQGWFKLPNQERIYRDWNWRRNNAGGQGRVDLHRAIYRSSNVYFYTMATRTDIYSLRDFAQQFGYGQVTAIDVADASSGMFPDPTWKRGHKGEPWYPGDTVNLSIGQGDLLVTPLQLATVASVIANRGRWRRPRMLLSSDEPLAEFDPPPVYPPVGGVSPEDWERMIDSMEDVVHRGRRGPGENGTAWSHIGRSVEYRMAGKSGTSQVVEIKQGEEYDEEELDEYRRKHAWFMAFAPADKPEIALAVLVENGGGGSSVAGPVAREVLDAYLLPQLALK